MLKRTAAGAARLASSPSPATAASHRISSPANARPYKPRLIVLAGAFVAITIVGTITGAVLKQDRDTRKERERMREMSLDDKIDLLEIRRTKLVEEKVSVERKLAGVRARGQPKGQGRQVPQTRS